MSSDPPDADALTRAEARAARLAARLEVLNAASSAFAEASVDYERLLDLVARRTSEVMHGPCVVRLVSDDGAWLPLAAMHADDAEFHSAALAAEERSPQRADEGFCGAIIRQGEALLAPEITPEARLAQTKSEHRSLFERFPFYSVVGAPLRAHGKVIGVMMLARHVPGRPFDADDATVVQDLADRAALAIASARLIEDLRRARLIEERLLHAQKMEAIGRLAGAVAHDFNNIMSVIVGYAALMRADLPAGDPLSEGLAEISRAASRATRLSRQLLTFSHRHGSRVGALDLNAVIRDVERLLLRLLGEDVELTTRLAPGLALVRGDAGQAEQVLMNLAINARDAMPDGGRLLIETRTSAPATDRSVGASVELTVTDTGHGMDADTRARVFEPFFTTKSPGHGTGLGLATVYGIVTGWGGEVTVESQPGRGATFRIVLPCSDEAAKPPSEHPRPLDASVRGGDETVLLTEDDDAVRELARSILARVGYRVLAARNAGEALLVAEHHAGPIDLLLTDVVMPYLSGPDLAARLAPMRPDMRVVYMSGYTAGQMRQRDSITPGTTLIEKPFSVDDLVRAVRVALDAPRPG